MLAFLATKVLTLTLEKQRTLFGKGSLRYETKCWYTKLNSVHRLNYLLSVWSHSAETSKEVKSFSTETSNIKFVHFLKKKTWFHMKYMIRFTSHMRPRFETLRSNYPQLPKKWNKTVGHW
jgi:hypothetical protein